MNAGIAGIVRVLHPIVLGCCYDFEFDVRNFLDYFISGTQRVCNRKETTLHMLSVLDL